MHKNPSLKDLENVYLTITFIHDLDLRLECSVSGGWGGGGSWVWGRPKCGVGNILDPARRVERGGGQGGVTLQLHSGGWSLFYPL